MLVVRLTIVLDVDARVCGQPGDVSGRDAEATIAPRIYSVTSTTTTGQSRALNPGRG